MKIAVYCFLCFGCAAGLLASFLPAMNDEMNLVKVHVDSFTVVGIETRTSNALETSDGAIGKMWGRAASDSLLTRVQHRVDTNIIVVYSEYESDKDGPYTYTLGAKVSSAHDIPPGMVSRRVRSGDYAMFTARGGPPPQMNVELWKRIWSLEKPQQLWRAYKTDFEVHYKGLQAQPPDTHIDIYVGLQK